MRRLVVAVASVLVLSFVVGAWWLRPVEAARPTTAGVTPFQVELVMDVVPSGGPATTSFVVPPGKLLNLRFLTSRALTASENPRFIRIQTTVNGDAATHGFFAFPPSGSASPAWLDRSIDLWADESSLVVVTVDANVTSISQVVVTLSGELI